MVATARIRLATVADLGAIAALESASYPADEAANREMLEYRLGAADDCFVVGEQDGEVVGFVCATRAHGSTLTHESMHRHVDDGESLCIHSVVVAESWRRRGLALQMLAQFAVRARDLRPPVEQILLVTKESLIELYEKAGFTRVGPSELEHGLDRWFEMAMPL